MKTEKRFDILSANGKDGISTSRETPPFEFTETCALRTFSPPDSNSVRPEFVEGLFTATKTEERFDGLSANGTEEEKEKQKRSATRALESALQLHIRINPM